MSNTILISPDLSAGGTLSANFTSSGTTFTTPRENVSSFMSAGYLYVIGGDDGTIPYRDVQYIAVNPTTGALSGSWAFSGDLPQAVSYATGFTANGYIYIIGGATGATANTCLATTYIASVNNTGVLSQWSQSANNLASARFGAATAFYNGYYYSAGGHDCTAIVSTNVLQYGGEQSQAMKGLVSKYADFNGNGVPLSFVGYLTNAVNNGVDIEKWRLTYQASMEATDTWGKNTAVYPLVNEAKNTVTAIDAAGATTQLARWFWMTFDINMEQSFSFTDDTQPSISQYELYYTPPAAKRLMHGRDFRDQTQQGLDAHP
jgi:hypothetical protein